MKRLFLVGLLVLVAVLDWLALDDITTGKEPDYFLEYLVLTISIIAFIFTFKVLKGNFEI